MKIYFDTIGCRLNQSEIERMAAQARMAGHEVVSQASQADIAVINTCAVTIAASADSRKKIRQAARAGAARIAATGCYATVAPEIIKSMPEVNWVFLNSEKDEVISRILGVNSSVRADESEPRKALPGKHRRTRAFIKVQDGCENFCTFCITRIARGKSKSQTADEIFKDIESALAGGAKEIVLTGVNLGSWGRDLDDKPTFSWLVGRIIEMYTPKRIRLSSLEPWDIADDFLEVLEMPGFCHHLHLPLQSGSAGMLKRMGRRNTPQDFKDLLGKIREVVPQIAITTDIMVGFPGESEQEFLESVDFVKAMHFAGGHVFNFSVRPGTAAEKMPNSVPTKLRKERSWIMRQVVEESRVAYQSQFADRVQGVLWEKARRIDGVWRLEGLTDNYLRVEAEGNKNLRNTLSKVKLLNLSGKIINGEIVG